MAHFVSFVAGLIFALGLVLGGMTQPGKVIGFLDVSGPWDPSLAFVMGAALLVYGVAFRLTTGRSKPVFAQRFQIPSRRDLPPRLFVGAGLFGVGWALAGFCPGPAIVGAGSGMTEALLFLPGMVGGMTLFRAWDGYMTEQRAARERAERAVVPTAANQETNGAAA
ncbi:MAG: YeeE/YedE family protein [Deltaproteobacteria bacterium]|nr:YeeE/YedE family protein [Deltaproteobacteria bacterium]